MSYGLLLGFELLNDNNNKIDLDPVFNDVSEWLNLNLKKYCTTSASKNVHFYYMFDWLTDSYFDEDQSIIFYNFRSPAGACDISAAVSCHWIEMSVNQLFEPLNKLIEKYNCKIKSSNLIEKNTFDLCKENKFIEHGGIIHKIYLNEEGGNHQIINDNDWIYFNDATQGLKNKVNACLDKKRCCCSFCNKLHRGTKPITIKKTRYKKPPETHYSRLSTALRFPKYAKSLYMESELEITDRISELAVLEELCFWQSTCSGISSDIGKLPLLKRLDISPSFIECKIPDSIGDLINLKELKLSIYWGFKKCPKTIGKLENLEILEIGSNELSDIPNEILKLKKLKTLHIKCEKNTEIPDITQLENLTEIDFINSSELGGVLEEFPFHKMPNIKVVKMRNTGLQKIPKNLLKIEELQELDLSSNSIKEIPKEISNLKSLKRLDLGGNPIEVIPKEVFDLVQLESLMLGDEKLKEIQGDIGNLVNLDSLGLLGKAISVLPDSIGDCKKLTWLKIAGTNILSLPIGFKNCESLKYFQYAYYDEPEREKAIKKSLKKLGMPHLI